LLNEGGLARSRRAGDEIERELREAASEHGVEPRDSGEDGSK
jgi:hypothetical protein